jgi:ketosteroid isomerase-like protein
MKNMNLKLAGIFVVALIMTINTYSQKSDDTKAKIEKLNKDMAQAMIDGNSEKTLSLYASDAISLPNYKKMVEGIDAIKMSNEEMIKSGMKVKTFETTTLKVTNCDNLVIEVGTYKMSFTMAGMDAPMSDNGKYITVWEKQKDGSLKIKIETWNTDNNPWEHMDKMDNKDQKK